VSHSHPPSACHMITSALVYLQLQVYTAGTTPVRCCPRVSHFEYMPREVLLLLSLLLHPFNDLFSRKTWVSRHLKGKTSLDLHEANDYGVLRCSGISWTICKQSALRSRQITTPTPHHSIFTGWMLFLTPNQQCQSTEGQGTEGHAMCICYEKGKDT